MSDEKEEKVFDVASTDADQLSKRIEFVAMLKRMDDGFASVRAEMREGFAGVNARIDGVSDRLQRIEEENTGSHDLDLHRRMRCVEKHLFEKGHGALG
jgi:hypothetical protein